MVAAAGGEAVGRAPRTLSLGSIALLLSQGTRWLPVASCIGKVFGGPCSPRLHDLLPSLHHQAGLGGDGGLEKLGGVSSLVRGVSAAGERVNAKHICTQWLRGWAPLPIQEPKTWSPD